MNDEILKKLQTQLAHRSNNTDADVDHSRYTVRDANGTRTVIHNAPFIFTCDEHDKTQVLRNHSVVIDGDTITAVQPAATVNLNEFDTVYDAGKRGGIVLTPGFINTHTHPPMYLMRSAMMLDEGEGIDETIAAMPAWERTMTDEDYTLATVGDITEQQKYGITTIMSHYGIFYPIEYATCLTGHNVINAVSAISNSHPENSPRMIADLLAQKKDFTSQVAIAVHYLYKANPDALREIQKLVSKHDTLFTVHMAESPMVEEQCIRTFGKREVEVLEEFDLLNDRTVVSHVIYVKDNEVQTLADSRVGIAHLPTSNVIHKSGTFPFWKFWDANGFPQLTLGTDGVISKSRLDLLTEAYQTRITHLYHRTVKFSSLFKMMTVNGARVLHMPNRGRIAPGFKADIVFWKLKDRGCIPYDEHDPMTLLGNIITHGGRVVRDLMTNGRFTIKNRKHQLVNESSLLEALQHNHMAMRARIASQT